MLDPDYIYSGKIWTGYPEGPLPTDYAMLDLLYDDPTGSICWSCSRWESFRGLEPYCVCFECGHVYRTDADLIASYERDVEWTWDGPAHEIPFCPECLHDF